MLTVRLPQGWAAAGTLSRNIGPAFRGDVLRADFPALAGGSCAAGCSLPVNPFRMPSSSRRPPPVTPTPAGSSSWRAPRRIGGGARRCASLTGRVELPAGPSDIARDVSVSVPDLAALQLARVPQDAAGRPIEDWLASRPLSQSEASGLERLAALVALDPAFRLAMVAPASAVASGARAAAVLQRYLTGPALVPRERLIFAISEFARPGQLSSS